jgi:uncharacterized protein (DUF849 family)
MTTPCIISVAITGSLPRKKDNPALPVSVAEQVESTHAAYDAGATLVHLHVRNDDESPTSSPERLRRCSAASAGTAPASSRRSRPAGARVPAANAAACCR